MDDNLLKKSIYRPEREDFNPLDFDCDVEGCSAKAGEFCDSENRGVHVMRALDELEKVMVVRKRKQEMR